MEGWSTGGCFLPHFSCIPVLYWLVQLILTVWRRKACQLILEAKGNRLTEEMSRPGLRNSPSPISPSFIENAQLSCHETTCYSSKKPFCYFKIPARRTWPKLWLKAEQTCQNWQDINFKKIKKLPAGRDHFNSFNPHCYADPHQLKIWTFFCVVLFLSS